MPHPRRPPRTAAIVAALVVAVGVAVTAGAILGPVIGGAKSTPSPSMVAAAPSAASPTAAPTPIPSPAVTPAPTRAPTLVPLVPIVSFWSAQRFISRVELAGLIDGDGQQLSANPVRVAVSAADLGPLAAVLRVTPHGVRTMPPDEVLAWVKATPNALGIVPADSVAIGVRALSVDGVQLFGAARTRSLDDWPLMAPEIGVTYAFGSDSTWTMAVGGDVMLDKAVYAQSILNGYGVDFAWDGGTAAIDGRYCCGWGGPNLAAGHRTGYQGAFGDLFRNADLALVNLESPEPSDFTYHSSGFTFTGDPDLLTGLKRAGVDLVSMANNHLGDGGLHGVTDEIGYLDGLGIAHAGAGADVAAARKPGWLSAGGLRIAVLAYCWVEPESYWATPYSAGSAGYSIDEVVAGIRAARAAGADYVIVMPHWGNEYTDAVLPEQSADAQRMIDAGANLVLGSHSHWFGPMQRIGTDSLVFYSFGDLIFDWTHDERTQESAVADLTFVGRRLVQVDLHPTFIIDGQPNLLEPAGDGRVVLDEVHATSGSLLGW